MGFTQTFIKKDEEQWPDGMLFSKVLIVDDLSFYTSLVKQTLDNHGFKGSVDYASNLATAVQKISESIKSESVYQLIITDLNLPDGNGIDLAKKLRQNKYTMNMAIVLISTSSENDKIIYALQNGVDNFVIKPLDADDLFTKVKFAWNKRFPANPK
jgi:DNA-binding response OmpR family regulator